MLRSLMAQVLDSRKGIPQSLLKVFKKARNGKHQPTIGEIQEALVETLRRIGKTVFLSLTPWTNVHLGLTLRKHLSIHSVIFQTRTYTSL